MLPKLAGNVQNCRTFWRIGLDHEAGVWIPAGVSLHLAGTSVASKPKRSPVNLSRLPPLVTKMRHGATMG